MIQVNLLPPEHRPQTGTPIGRFVAILSGLVMVLTAGGFYAYTHFIELAKVQELREARTAEAEAKERLRDRSLALQREIDTYDKRRRAIQTINRSRTLWSKKLDQFFDIVTAEGDDEQLVVWLDTIDVPQQVVAARKKKRRSKKKQKIQPGGRLRFGGSLAMDDDADAPRLLAEFHRSITGDPERTRQPTPFFLDFMSISNPGIEMVTGRRTGSGAGGGELGQLVPPHVGSFRYELALNPIQLDAKKKAPGDDLDIEDVLFEENFKFGPNGAGKAPQKN